METVPSSGGVSYLVTSSLLFTNAELTLLLPPIWYFWQAPKLFIRPLIIVVVSSQNWICSSAASFTLSKCFSLILGLSSMILNAQEISFTQKEQMHPSYFHMVHNCTARFMNSGSLQYDDVSEGLDFLHSFRYLVVPLRYRGERNDLCTQRVHIGLLRTCHYLSVSAVTLGCFLLSVRYRALGERNQLCAHRVHICNILGWSPGGWVIFPWYIASSLHWHVQALQMCWEV